LPDQDWFAGRGSHPGATENALTSLKSASTNAGCEGPPAFPGQPSIEVDEVVEECTDLGDLLAAGYDAEWAGTACSAGRREALPAPLQLAQHREQPRVQAVDQAAGEDAVAAGPDPLGVRFEQRVEPVRRRGLGPRVGQSERGEQTIERLLSASVTCRLQGRSLFAYLAGALGARVRGDPAPLLA